MQLKYSCKQIIFDVQVKKNYAKKDHQYTVLCLNSTKINGDVAAVYHKIKSNSFYQQCSARMRCRNWKLRLLISFQNSAIGLPCNVQSDLEDQSNELRNAEDQAKKAMADAARLADELRQEQDHAAQIEKMRRALENQVLVFCLPSLPCDLFFFSIASSG